MVKWGTNSWQIEETTLHKAGSSAVFNIALEREGRKRGYYNTGYSYLVTHPSANPAEQGLTSSREDMNSINWPRSQCVAS